MANLRIFNPLIDDSFDRAFQGLVQPFRFETEVNLPQIKIDVEEDEKAYTVKADIPGVNKEDISVQIDGGTVSIQAESKKEKDVKEGKGKILRTERQYGMVSRTFSVIHDIDEASAEAHYESGVLRLVLPKKQSAAAKRLEIK